MDSKFGYLDTPFCHCNHRHKAFEHCCDYDHSFGGMMIAVYYLGSKVMIVVIC